MWRQWPCCLPGLPDNHKTGQYSTASCTSEQAGPCTPKLCQQLSALASAYLDRVPNGWCRRAIHEDRAPYPFPTELNQDVKTIININRGTMNKERKEGRDMGEKNGQVPPSRRPCCHFRFRCWGIWQPFAFCSNRCILHSRICRTPSGS